MPDLEITNALTEKALMLIENGHLIQARTLYEKICQHSPKNAEARMMLGAVKGELDDAAGAIVELQEALRLQPELAEAHILLSNLKHLQGNAMEAIIHLQQVVTIDPDHSEAWIMLGALHGQLGQINQAENCCRRALVLQPDSIDAYMNLANALLSQGKYDEAAENYKKVLIQQPALPLAWLMLGQTHARVGLQDEAVGSLRQSLALDPGLVDAHVELGHILRAQGKTADAQTCYQQALRLNPNLAVAHYSLGVLLHLQHRFPEAETSYREAVRLKPDYIEAYHNLGRMLASQGETQRAADSFKQVLNIRPDDTEASFLLSTLGAAPTPLAAPAEFVTKLFDDYADHFDKHLTQQLEYRTPEHLRYAVSRVLGETKNVLNVLDLGCGTGLCGPLFRGLASRLTGVDLSTKMIEKARERQVYDELFATDIITAMHATNAMYDIIIAADVFVYIGDLATVFDMCRTALKPGGLFVFSVEATENTETYMLHSTCRYAHAASYIRQLAQSTSLQELSFDVAILRKQEDQPIQGYIFVLKKIMEST